MPGDESAITLVPHTTSTRATNYEAVVTTRFLKTGAFDGQGIVTVPANRAIRLLGTLSASEMRAVEAAVWRWLELPCEM